MEHKAPRRHTPTKDRMSFKRRRDQWPGMPFPVSGQRRVTRRSQVTRTRNFSRKAARERGDPLEGKGETLERTSTGKRKKKKRGNCVCVGGLCLSPPSSLLTFIRGMRVISSRSISRCSFARRNVTSVYRRRNICATVRCRSRSPR